MPVSPIPFDLTVLVASLQQKQQPVLIHDLAYQTAAAYLHTQLPKRQYAPGATYQTGETIWHKGQLAQIVTAQWGQNQKQGRFQMLQLRLNNGEEAWLAAAISQAPAQDQAPTPKAAINQLLDQQGLTLRTAIQKTLAQDNRFVHFQNGQGDSWCLRVLLPPISEPEIRQVYNWLDEAQVTDGLRPQPTHALVERLWGQVDDGTPAYLCRVFALNATLQQYAEFHYLIGGGWLLRQTWDSYRERAALVGPRQRNVVPRSTAPVTNKPSPTPIEVPDEKETPLPLDIQEWEQKRRLNAAFTLTAHHFVGQWLPLNQDTQFVLPPCPMAVTFHCQWAEDSSSFTAYVDPDSGRILADALMADIFQQANIYPGARLVISRRENWQDYDVRLKPLATPRLVRVRRLDLNEQEQLDIYDDDQLVTYEIDENEFVAQARWEQLKALFQQAGEAGAGIFQLMFETCQRWEQERGKPLLVTEAELFEAVHFGSRMTSRATIALEMWQRNAFERQADGRYLFRPEQGDRTRPHPNTTRYASPLIQPAIPQRRLRLPSGSPAEPTQPVKTRPRIPFHRDANLLWQAIMGDTTRQAEIESAIQTYQQDAFRGKMILLRGLAHQRIREMLAPRRLNQLTMDDFNRHVWQIGSFHYQRQTGRIDRDDGALLLSRLTTAEMEKAVAENKLVFTGNQTWGSGSGIYDPQMKGAPKKKLDQLQKTLAYLLYDHTPIAQRIERVLKERNGFGINIVTGLLHAVFPDEFILYNQRSADMLQALDVEWPPDWRQNVPAYLAYRNFCLRLRQQYNFHNLTDVDWFIYGWGQWHTGEIKQSPISETGTFLEEISSPPAPPVFPGPRPRIITHDDEDEIRYRGQPLTPFWMAVQKLEGEQLLSKVADLALHITRIRSYRIEFQRNAGQFYVTNAIPRSELETLWDELVRTGERHLTPEEAEQPGFSILAELPGVQVTQKPLRLLYRAPGSQLPVEPSVIELLAPASAVLERTRTGQTVAVNLVPPGPLFEPGASPAVEASPTVEAFPAPLSATPAAPEVPTQSAPAVLELVQVKQLVLSHLVGETIYTPQGKPNRIAAATDTSLTVITESGEDSIPWVWVEDVYKALRQKGSLERQDVQEGEFRTPGGFRSAFIFGLLIRFSHIMGQTRPRTRLAYRTPDTVLNLRPVGFSPASDLSSPPIINTSITNTPIANPPTSRRPAKPVSINTDMDTLKTSKSLFSRHYLQNRLPDHPEWQEDISHPLAQLQTLYQQVKDRLPNFNEAQTEQAFIQPVLDALGFVYTVQTRLRRSGGTQRPDYTLFTDAAAQSEAEHLLSDETAFYARAQAIADAKYWQRPLSARSIDNRDEFSNSNPSFQIVNYLIGSGVNWGILTNGRHWRLYSRLVSSTATEFYEIDLVELLEQGDPDEFKRFWFFFRREAFIPDAQGRNFLERVREGSTTYARRVSDRLKELVFADIFPLLAGGFVADGTARGEDLTSEASRALIYEATLSLLYKLLFLLYAEARYLLPTDHPGYRQESLTQMAQEIAGRLNRQERLGDTASTYYRRLLGLFEVIDRGDKALGLPRYNGGLFHFSLNSREEQEKHRANYFLTRYKVNDARLALALDRLARVDGEPVDYSYLEVRHLGAIYEGLLEYRLVIEDARAGQVHLATDKGERKATGSYYTPDYIVKYIVRHTVQPILQSRSATFADLMAQIVPKRQRLAELENLLLAGKLSDSVQARYKNEQVVLSRELPALEQRARETLLDIKLCDPAMGSGHFLVEAVDYLTDSLINILNDHLEHNPVLTWLEKIRADILHNMAEQGIAVDSARLDDTQLLQRAVMKRCIYGVDLNQMAVELAKVSLWLHSFTIGAPLSFLDHHLRWGNSLIGASARQAEAELARSNKNVNQPAFAFMTGPFKGLLRAAEIMRGIGGLSDATLAEVEESERLFQEFDQAARPYKQLLDMFVSPHFGVSRAKEFLTLYGVEALKAGPESVGPLYAETIRQTRQLFTEHHFFHWNLEFPEVFIDLDRADWKSNPGFDVIVGNPPYIRAENANKQQRQYIMDSGDYETVWGRFDVYMIFLEQGMKLLSQGGNLGFIVPDAVLTINYAEKFRQWILKEKTLLMILDARGENIFPGVSVSPCVMILKNQKHDDLEPVVIESLPEFKKGQFRRVTQQAEFLNLPGSAIRPDISSEDISLKLVIDRFSSPLSNYCYFTTGLVGHNSTTGESVKRLIHEQKINDTCKPYIEAKEWEGRYSWLIPERYIEYKPAEMHRAKFPELFESRKMLIQRLSSGPYILVTVDSQKIYVNHVINCCVKAEDVAHLGSKQINYDVGLFELPNEYSLYYLQALTASRLLGYYHNTFLSPALDIFPETLRQLPIRQISFVTDNTERAAAADQAKELYQQGVIQAKNFVPLLSLTIKHLAENHNVTIHDILAFLAEEMIRLNKDKQIEVNGFIDWLATYAHLPLERWGRKTIVQTYYETGWDELQRSLNQNARAIQQASGIDVQGRDALSRVRREYERSLTVLTPLLQQIQATDHLIDQIVYQLYGLTPEEIAIVEGRT